MFLFFLFWLQQYSLFKTTRATRLFPNYFFTTKDTTLTFIVQACAGGIVTVPLYLMALYYPFAHNDSALQAGVKLLPLVAFLVISIVLNGRLMSMFGYHQYWIVGGSVMVLVSGVYFTHLTVDSSDAIIWGLQAVLGAGTGAFSQAGFAIAQAMVEPSEIQNAISFMLVAQLVGTSLGLAISGAIFQNLSVPKAAAILGSSFSPEDVVKIVMRVDPGLLDSLSADFKRQVLDIVIRAITNGMSLLYVGGAVCLLCGVFLTPNRHLLGRKTASASTTMTPSSEIPESGHPVTDMEMHESRIVDGYPTSVLGLPGSLAEHHM
ncbi:Uu.00g044990.m01.CDS01 [Anthostomella pinea]|uniref:Uu.00g044990.m01.CDS01 n=1 Tax=Anthostomella pinea TaxID=933095 RepID=A0AAI8YE99_9PEZI|nr:Uu.00g044990.m01.CDS01 [Anthostomella pinea]